jgi:hypothetical protein
MRRMANSEIMDDSERMTYREEIPTCISSRP